MNIKKIAILISVAILVLMSACSVQANGNGKGTGTGNINSDASNYNSVENSNMSREGKSSNTMGEFLVEEQKIKNAAQGIKTLEIVNTAGNIKIAHSDSEQIEISVVKKVRGLNEKAKKEIMDNIDIKVEKVGQKLVISAGTRKKGGTNLWEWVQKLHEGLNVSIEYEVKVPQQGIEAFIIGNNAGNTTFESIQGELKVEQNAGNITLDKVVLNGSNSFKMNAGNIFMDANIDNASEVNVKGTAGNVNIKLPEKTAFSLESHMTAGNLSGSFLSGTKMMSGTLRQEYNGGGTKLVVTMSAGSVTIDKK